MTRSLLFVSTALAAGCGVDPAPKIAEPVPCQETDIPHCFRAGDVVLSGQPSPAGLERLAAQGYTTVVSTRGLQELDWDERAAVEALGMRFVQIPMENPVRAITDAQIATLDSVLANQQGPILLHCASGNRVAGLWGAWLAEKRGIDRAAAVQLATKAGMTGVRPVVEQRMARGSR